MYYTEDLRKLRQLFQYQKNNSYVGYFEITLLENRKYAQNLYSLCIFKLKTTMRYHYISTKMTETNQLKTSNFGKDMEQLKLPYIVGV